MYVGHLLRLDRPAWITPDTLPSSKPLTFVTRLPCRFAYSQKSRDSGVDDLGLSPCSPQAATLNGKRREWPVSVGRVIAQRRVAENLWVCVWF